MSSRTRSLISDKAQIISPSPTLALADQAASLRAQGKNVIVFAAGEPDLPAPASAQEGGIDAIQRGLGRYTAASGLRELREAVSARFQDSGLPYGPAEVMITNGAKTGLYEALYTVLNPGDEVLFPEPYWSSYPDLSKAAGGIPKSFPTSSQNDFQIDPEVLEAALSDRTRVLLINSPNNPSGGTYDTACLLGIAEAVRKRPNLLVLSDDIYECFTFGKEPFRNLLHVAPDLFNQVISVNGLSKSHAMTGWRIGYVGGPKELIAAMGRVQSQITGNPCAISQHAAIAALKAPLDPARAASLDRRRHLMVGALREIPGVICPEPSGAFYVFPDLKAFLNRAHQGQVVGTTERLASLILEEKLVAAICGEFFGVPGHLRLSYVCSDEDILEGVARIRDFLSHLTPL